MAVTSFIPKLWSARLLAHLDKAHVVANLVNRDYEVVEAIRSIYEEKKGC